MPNLCVPLLLGLPFLSINCIVTDFKERTAIDKMNDYNLLNPPVPKPQKRLINVKVAKANTMKNRGLMLTELVEVCKWHLTDGKMVPEVVKPLDVAGMIKKHVKALSFQQKVGTMEDKMLTEFADVFQPLPHIKKLPHNVTAKIKLRDAEQTIKT
jgi:hypothetical protein